MQADPVRLAQILNNLIANAFKYGDNFSPIRVRAHALEDGFGRIEIVNTGPGIPPGEREAVFLPFRRSADVGGGCRAPGWGFPSPSCWWKPRAGGSISKAFPAARPVSGSTCRWRPEAA